MDLSNSHSVSYASRVKSIDDGGMLVTSLVASPPLYIINVLQDGFAIFYHRRYFENNRGDKSYDFYF